MRRVEVASSSQLAADAGAAVADAGGNAVDVALAAVLVSMCAEPGIIAPGASGFLTIWPAGGDPVVIDANAEMPGRGLPPDRFGGGSREIHMDYGGGMRTIVGWGSVATPGAFAGFALASERFGALDWSQIVLPVAEIVRAGFVVPAASGEYLGYSHDAIFGWDPDSRAIVHRPDGTPIAAGDTVAIPDLADSLERIGEHGAAEFYVGELGRAIAAETQGGGGILTERDLAEYRPIVREPVRVVVDGWEVVTNPAPAVGGVAMSAMLLLLRDPPFAGWSTEGTCRVAEVQRAVMNYRTETLREYGSRGEAAALLLEHAAAGDLAALLRSPSTVHTSAVDSDGTACSVTVSAGYGSGAMVPNTGMWLNNSLGEMELTSEGFHALEPGTRLVSNMAPTVARRDDGSILAVGTPGADRITTCLSSVLLNFVHLGMSLSDAVAFPRLHVEVFDGKPTIAYEPGLPCVPFDDLDVRRFPDLSMYFGGVTAALWDPIAGLFGAADPRRTGGTARGGLA
jgi:gamma-glutamyltranspeptidase/glutathione hydrolase